MSRGLLAALAAVGGAALLALAFILGRESGAGSAPPPATRIERVAPRAPNDGVAPPSPRAPFVPVQPASPFAAAPAPGTSSVPFPSGTPFAAPTPAGERSAGVDPERASVGAYFDAIERIQVAGAGGAPEGIAQEMASALENGDTSSLDKLIRDTETARATLAALAAPPPCAGHHRESVASLDDSLALLRSLKAAMEASDAAAALADLSARGSALRARADALEREERALRERYGLTR